MHFTHKNRCNFSLVLKLNTDPSPLQQRGARDTVADHKVSGCGTIIETEKIRNLGNNNRHMYCWLQIR